MSRKSPSQPERRSFLTHLNAGVTSVAAVAIGSVAMAQEKSPAATRWEPARHDKDDWLEKPAVKHRLVFDTTTVDGLGEALAFASNFIRVNRTDYSVQENELAVLLVVRHRSTPFGYNDAMWAKYGAAMAAQSKFEDPKTKMPPTGNVYSTGAYGNLLPNRGVTFDSLSKQGVEFGICSVATRGYAGAIAAAVGGNSNAIFAELTANLVSNARMVPAGIVAVNRAQERGYSIVTA